MSRHNLPDVRQLPGGELVEDGLRDLQSGTVSDASLLLLVAAPRLEWLGVRVRPLPVPDPETALYRRLDERYGDGAHDQYNSLVRRIVSFADALAAWRRRP